MKEKKQLIRSYDELAVAYADRFCGELDGKPFDRQLLKRFAHAATGGALCDLGCGPGHVAAHLHTLGRSAFGVDLSPGMVAEARRRFPEVEYRTGDMVDLDIPEGSLGGIVALYSIIHLPRVALDRAIGEFFRVLAAGGQLLISFHQGQGTLHEDNVLETGVSFDCTLFEPGEVSSVLERAGFAIVELTVRRPYDQEYPTKRVYVWAEKPGEKGQ